MAAGARNVSFIQHDHVTAETPPELCWWCFEHDEGGSYIEGLNNADGRIALSSIGFMNFRLEGSVDRLAQFGHHFVDARYRGQHLFSSMIRSSEQAAQARGAVAVLVTPNLQSLHIYRHWGYEILHETASVLKLLIRREQKRPASAAVKNLQLADYIDQTKNFERLSQLSDEARIWRFSRPDSRYSFLHIKIDLGEVYLAYRTGQPGPIQPFILSEVFLNGAKPTACQIAAIVNATDIDLSRKKPLLFHDFDDEYVSQDIETYRIFPLAFKAFSADAKMHSMDLYQLTDTDYG